MKKVYFSVFMLLTLALAGCIKEHTGRGRDVVIEFVGTKTLEVASEMGYYVGFFSFPCTMLREAGSDKWFAYPVQGFEEYEPGYEYTIRADRYEMTYKPDNLEIDGDPNYYQLREVVSKTRRDTENIEWSLPCYDLWPYNLDSVPEVAEGELLIIRTVAEFEAIMGLPAEGWIKDFFDDHSLLVTSGTNDMGVERLTKRLIYKGKGDYLFQVEVESNDATALTPWTIAVGVPAISPYAKVELQVTAK
ncbi:MAG: DUF4377 domain-containing protein [Alistipes sp.]|jgi:hypothetical protein|nr:DUF4377 domain-containing protein [Alistipes sp.]